MAGSKVIFLDLDGTLLNDRKEISEKNRNTIAAAINNGNYLVIATGRPVNSARKVVRDLGLTFPGCYMIAFNGAVIYDCAADRILAEKTMNIEDVEYLVTRAKESGIYVQTYSKDYVLTEKQTKESEFYKSRTGMKVKFGEMKKLIQDEPHKVLLIDLDDRQKLEEFKKNNAKWAEGRCNCFFSSEKYLEYCPKDINKGWGVDYIREFLNIDVENTIAVGDAENDISMIERAYIGVAMKNGSDAIKEVADYITMNDNNEDGISEVIEKYILQIWG